TLTLRIGSGSPAADPGAPDHDRSMDSVVSGRIDTSIMVTGAEFDRAANIRICGKRCASA
ncbi:MAG: hypothetical protein ACRDQ1_18300, partial [Sciscionella sp.]